MYKVFNDYPWCYTVMKFNVISFSTMVLLDTLCM